MKSCFNNRHYRPIVGGAVSAVLILFFSIACVSCKNADVDAKTDIKEQSKMFDTDGVSYPVRFANYQRNSFVPAEIGGTGRVAWSKNYFEIDETLLLIPRSVQVSGGFLGVISTNDLLVFSVDGEFRFGVETGENKPVVLGSGAVAYTKPSYQLEYRDFDGKMILESRGFPGLKDYCRLHLLKPSGVDFLAAVEFSGGPERLPAEYDVYKIGLEESIPPWSFCGEGVLDHVLLDQNGTALIVIQGADVTLLDTADGKKKGSFTVGMDEILSASLDLENNLLLVGSEDRGGPSGPVLKVIDPGGEERSSYRLVKPAVHQPPACGTGERIYVVDAMHVKCLAEGETAWSFSLRSGQPAWLTVTAENRLICLNGGFLSIYDSAGELIFDTVLADGGETFDAPAAPDLNGRLYIAGGEKLYCVE